MKMAILGIGTALPAHSVRQSDGEALARSICEETGASEAAISALFRKSGIATRHTVFPALRVIEWLRNFGLTSSGDVQGGGPSTGERMRLYGKEAQPLALEAARRALRASAIEPREISHLVTVSCTGFGAPGIDIRLAKALGLRPTVERLHVGFMGCHGAVNGLRAAAAFAAPDPRARVLVCAVEICSLHYNYGRDCEKFIGNALFADGAAALAGAAAEVAPSGSWRVASTGSCIFEDSEGDMTWEIGDHGFEMKLTKRVPDLIRGHLRPWLDEWLGSQGVETASVGSWAIHPGGPKILSAAEEGLGLASDATRVSREVLSECGNMSSPTLLFIIDRLAREGARLPCVVLGFGPGLVAEALLLD